MAKLKLNNVVKVYPSGSLALYNVNFETEDKEFIVIVGGEKSGKSTLLRVISGLEDLSSGEILIDGKDVSGEEPKDRDVAVVFRNATLSPSQTIFDNLAYGLKLRKAPQTLIEQRVKVVSEILGLNDVLYRKSKALTAAQKQRVALGRAIVREPALYLLDEPLSGLDDKLKAELLNVIINLQARMEGTFVYATKNVAEAMTIGTRIVVLKNGIVQQIDSPANLYDYPANCYVAFYIGSPTINFINKAAIIKTEAGVFAEAGAFKIQLPENIINRFKNIDEYANTDRRVVIGIRPEDAGISTDGFDGEIGKAENGYAQCEISGHPLNVKAGSGKKIKINNERLYLFDDKTRLTLLSRDGGYKDTGFKDAEYVPYTFEEEEQIVVKHKPVKNSKNK